MPALLALPAVTGALREPRARTFFLGFFALALVNFVLSDYEAEARGDAEPTEPYAARQLAHAAC